MHNLQVCAQKKCHLTRIGQSFAEDHTAVFHFRIVFIWSFEGRNNKAERFRVLLRSSILVLYFSYIQTHNLAIRWIRPRLQSYPKMPVSAEGSLGKFHFCETMNGIIDFWVSLALKLWLKKGNCVLISLSYGCYGLSINVIVCLSWLIFQ